MTTKVYEIYVFPTSDGHMPQYIEGVFPLEEFDRVYEIYVDPSGKLIEMEMKGQQNESDEHRI